MPPGRAIRSALASDVRRRRPLPSSACGSTAAAATATMGDSRARVWPKRSVTCPSSSHRGRSGGGVSVGQASISGALLGTMAGLGVRHHRCHAEVPPGEFEGLALDEAPLAAEVAARYGARHIVRTVRPRRVRARPAGAAGRHGPADGRRHQLHLVRRQGRARSGHQGGAERSGRRRMLRRLPRPSPTCRAACTGCDRSRGCRASARWCGEGCRRRHLRRPQPASQGGGRAAVRRQLGRRLPAATQRLHALGDSTRCSIRRWWKRACVAWRRSTGSPPRSRLASRSATSIVSPRSRRRSTCATSSCAMPTGRGCPHGVEIRVPFVDPFFLAALPPGAVLAGMNAKDAIARKVPDPPLPDSVRHAAQDRLLNAGRTLAA